MTTTEGLKSTVGSRITAAEWSSDGDTDDVTLALDDGRCLTIQGRDFNVIIDPAPAVTAA